MLTIDPNVLKALFQQVYFICGPASAGKSALVRALAEKHRGVMCGGDYHDELLPLTTPESHSALHRFGTDDAAPLRAALTLPPEEYAAWFQEASREAAGLELLLLIRLTAYGRPIFADTRIPADLLAEFGAKALVIAAPQEGSDPDDSMLQPLLEAAPDPEAALANFRACRAKLNDPACCDEYGRSGFPVHTLREDSPPEEAIAFAGEVFGLSGAD